MKKNKIIFTNLIIILLIVNVFVVKARERDVDKKIFSADNQEIIVCTFTWNTGNVDVTLVTPNGAHYDKDTNNGYINVSNTNNSTMFSIYTPEKGNWRAVYSLQDNQSVNVKVDKGGDNNNDVSNIKVKEFQILQQPDNAGNLIVRLKANCIGINKYSYRIFVSNKDNSSATLEMSRGEAIVEEVKDININVSNLATGDYFLSTIVSCQNQGQNYMDEARSNEFHYANENKYENTNEKKENEFVFEELSLLYNCNEKNLLVKWNDAVPFDVDKIIINAYEGDSKEPYTTKEVNNDVNDYVIDCPEKLGKIKVKVNTLKSDVLGEPTIKEIDLNSNSMLKIQYPKENLTKDKNLILPYSNGFEGKVRVMLNSYDVFVDIHEEDIMQLVLQEGINKFYLEVSNENGVGFFETKEFFLDTKPPSLKVLKSLKNKHTSQKSIDIVGITDSDSNITINNINVKVNANGEFTYNYQLEKGQNDIYIFAKDKAGNTEIYEGTVFLDSNKHKNIIWIIIIVLIVILIYFWYYNNNDFANILGIGKTKKNIGIEKAHLNRSFYLNNSENNKPVKENYIETIKIKYQKYIKSIFGKRKSKSTSINRNNLVKDTHSSKVLLLEDKKGKNNKEKDKKEKDKKEKDKKEKDKKEKDKKEKDKKEKDKKEKDKKEKQKKVYNNSDDEFEKIFNTNYYSKESKNK